MSNEKNKIEKMLRYAAAHGLSALKLGQLLTQKYDITPVEATRWMDEYRNRFSGTLTKRIHSIPGPVTSRVNKGENIQTPKQIAEAVLGPTVPDLTAEIQVTNREASGISNYQPSILNRSAVKSFALEVSKQLRAGKFDRVGKSFFQGVESDAEALLRQIGGSQPEQDVPGEYSFINCKRAFAKAEQQFNLAIRKIILRRVKSQPSNGQTLK